MCFIDRRYTAPLLKDIDITFRPVQFAGSLLKENIYRQNASDEVDAAWVELGVDCPSIHLTEYQ